MITIIQDKKHLDRYWINTQFVLYSNWEISKHRFSTQEQKAFESYMKMNGGHKNSCIYRLKTEQ